MSPEQARGLAVDTRVDLWAFGCVCYEMLVGRRVFDGETASDAISLVLTRDPDWSALPPTTPEPLRRLLRRCLARDLSQRQRHAGDARLEIEDIVAGQSLDAAATPTGQRATTTPYLKWTIAAAALVVAVGAGWRTWSVASATTGTDRTTRVELALAAGLELYPSTSSTVLASPDGQSVAFIGTSGGDRQLFLRRLDAFDATAVRGTIGATTGAFSPDSSSLVFVTAGGELKTVSLADGLVTTLARDASLLYGLIWAAPEQIVFTRQSTLWSVAAAGGNATQLTMLDDSEQMHAWPSALPDGRTVLFTVDTAAGPRIDAVTLSSGERRVVLNQAARAKIGPEGRLFFYRNDRMLAAAFDASALSVLGSPVPVADIVAELGGGTPVGDVSPSGLIVFSVRTAAASSGVGITPGYRRAGDSGASRLHEPAAFTGQHPHRPPSRRDHGARSPSQRGRARADAECCRKCVSDLAA
jgi:hypothetical protein